MKLEWLKMNLQSLKRRRNNKKSSKIKGKITKSSITFSENKANFKTSEIGVSSFAKSKYEILPAWRGKKTNPSKPNLSQNKPNSNPICFKTIIGLSSSMTSKYEKSEDSSGKKQTQTNPKQACPRMSRPGSPFN
jgi:hypothetical protein